MNGKKPKREEARRETRGRREEIRGEADKQRDKLRAKARGAAGALCLFAALLIAAGCNTATPASKSASSKACGNTTIVNNYIGLAPTNGPALQPSAPLLFSGLTISVSDLNGTIAQSADTAGGDATDLSATPTMTSGITGDAPIEAIQKAVAAYASPQDSLGAALASMVKKFGWGASTNALAAAAAACADGACGTNACADGSCATPAAKQ